MVTPQTQITKVIGSSGKRKYGPIWATLKDKKMCEVKCDRKDSHTIISMVKKEKVRDKNKPKGKILDCEVTDTGVIFRLKDDISIRNL